MYYLIYGVLRFFSLFPIRVLYLFSDFIYFLGYYVIGYRKNVVLGNLRIAFPEKTERERVRIARDFYHLLTDTLMETIKFLSWSLRDIEKRCTVDFSTMEELYTTGRAVHLVGMHNFNWEFMNAMAPSRFHHPFLAVYMPLGNPHLERIFRKLRQKHGSHLIRATQYQKEYAPWRNRPHFLGTIADQSPADPRNAWWVDFFGQPTAFSRGPERHARAADAAVVFAHFYPLKRGHYTIRFQIYARNVSALEPGQLARDFAIFTEDSIRKTPANYLWSHRRWKHAWSEEYSELRK